MRNPKSNARLKIPLLAACLLLSAGALNAAAGPPRSSQPAVDWDALGAGAGQYFQGYLRYDSSNPPGDTKAAIGFLKGILDLEEIPYQTFAAAPGKLNLVARLPGPQGVKPLLFMSHVDVVPANAADWSHYPFSGDYSDGYIWGRGAIDDKSQGLMALMTLVALKRQNLALRRGVEVMVNCDEETGGELGAKWMVEKHWDAIDPAFVINEGGAGTPHWLGSKGITFRVAVAEKRALWLKLIAHGRSGHGSLPNPENPNLILIGALSRILAAAAPMRLTPVVGRALQQIAPRMPFPASFELAHLNFPWMLSLASMGPLSDYTAEALLQDTIAPTMLDAGMKVNVIPATAQASLDCRLLPGTDEKQFLEQMRNVINDPRITIEFIQKPDDVNWTSPTSGAAWEAINQVVKQDFPGALVVPSLEAGATDSRFMRRKRVPAYGFSPIILERGEYARVHGVDERLSVENFLHGIRATYDLAFKLCAKEP